MAKARQRHHQQADLFETRELFPVRSQVRLPRAVDFSRTLSMAMSEAIRLSGKTRAVIAAEMTEILGYEDDRAVTVAMLNKYTSAASESHTISLIRFKVFVRVTGATWLWDEVLADDGLTILQGPEALHAQASLLEKQGRDLLERARAARAAAPLQVRVPRGRR